MGAVQLALLLWIPFLCHNVAAQIIRGPYRGPCGRPCQYYENPVTGNVPVFNQAAASNALTNLNLPLPTWLAQLANTGIRGNYGYGQNLQINNLPINSLPLNQPIATRSPKTVLIKLNIPIVKRVPRQNMPLYNNIPYTLGNNLKITDLPWNRQIINNFPVNTLPRETIQPSYNYVQHRLANNRMVTNVPVVPFNGLSNLPTFNGMPVIKVKKTLYKI